MHEPKEIGPYFAFLNSHEYGSWRVRLSSFRAVFWFQGYILGPKKKQMGNPFIWELKISWLMKSQEVLPPVFWVQNVDLESEGSLKAADS